MQYIWQSVNFINSQSTLKNQSGFIGLSLPVELKDSAQQEKAQREDEVSNK